MKNELLHIGPFTIYGYGLMIAIGVLCAFTVAEKRSSKVGMNTDQVLSLGIWSLIGGLLGAKLLFVIVELPTYLSEPGKIISDLANGFVVYGGIIGGALTGFIYTKIKKIEFSDGFDLIMPSVALAQAFGRIGCFLAGCCYGHETTSWFHIVFEESAYAPNGVWLYPTQLMSSVGNFLNFGLLIWFASRKQKYSGQVGSLYLMLYSVGRFVIEQFRGDPRGVIGPFSTSEMISIVIFALGLILMLYYTGKKQPVGKCVAAEEKTVLE